MSWELAELTGWNTNYQVLNIHLTKNNGWISQGSVSGHRLLSIFLSTLGNKTNCKCAEKKFTWRIIQTSSPQRGCGVARRFSRADEKTSELASTSVGNSLKLGGRGWTRWPPEIPSNPCLCDPVKMQCRNLIAQDSNSNLGNKHSHSEEKAYLSLTHRCTK